MNYRKIYNNIIQYAINQHRIKTSNDGLDRHHILPRSLGGTNDKTNLVLLSCREHYVAHKLLVKMYTGEEKKKMIYALWWMSKTYANKSRISSRDYEYARKMFIQANVNNSPERKERFIKNRLAGNYKYDDASMGKTLSASLNKLTLEEKRQRMLKSTMTADHDARCRAIKRGKASLLEVTNTDGSTEKIYSDEVQDILGLSWPQVKYRVNAHNGLLVDGRKVIIVAKYTGGNKWKNK